MLSYWCRSGIAIGVMKQGDESIPGPPGPAFGDSIGAMTIAGGIMGALYHRERTGEATVVDVSLLGVGLWSHGAALALSLSLDVPWGPMPRVMPTGNPLVSTYKTKDDRFISMSCLQPGKYWPPMCDVIDRPDLVTDERFKDAEGLRQNSAEGTAILAEIFLGHTADEWREMLADFPGQWAVVQNSLEAAADPQTVANGYIVEHETAEGRPFQLAAAPIQYDEVVPSSGRAPEFNEHGDDILTDLGLDMDAIIDLKVRGVVA
jgi:crotonobetainyl-CoA:carnitine CoA-transferase CaiB-like acyl-CoA transferase